MANNMFLLGIVFLPLVGAVLTVLLSPIVRNNDMTDLIVNPLQRWVAFAANLAAWACSMVVLRQALDSGTQVYAMGGWTPPFGIVLVADSLSALFGVMATTVTMLATLYMAQCWDKCVNYPAFVTLALTMSAGLFGSFYTGDIFSFFVFMELMVLSSVTLVAISDDRLGLEAAFKYLFISGTGTLLLLLGIAAIYATFGTLNLAHVAEQLQALEGERPLLARSAAVMLVSAFLLKSAVFPFHFWQPDFHTTAPTPIHAVLSSVVVKVGIYAIIRLMTLWFTEEAAIIGQLVMILGVIGIFFGSFSALRTNNGKRLLAYSTIGQIGFILVGIGWWGMHKNELALAAAIIYAFNHAFVKSALLMVMGLVSSRNSLKSAVLRPHDNPTVPPPIIGIGTEIPPIIGWLWLLGGMALAGVPPMNGFISKLGIVQSGAAVGDWLVVFLAVSSGVLSLSYVFRTWQSVFQQKREKDNAPEDGDKPKFYVKSFGDSTLAPTLLISICVVLGLYAQPLVEAATRTVTLLQDPNVYINAVKLFGG